MSKSKVFCCVIGCNSTYKRTNHVSFHCFPKVNDQQVEITNKFGEKEFVDRRLAWVLILKMGKPVTSSMRVCSMHFKKEDFILPGIPSHRRCLKVTAVPSINLPKVPLRGSQASSKITLQLAAERAVRRAKRQLNSPKDQSSAKTIKLCNNDARATAADALLELSNLIPEFHLPEEIGTVQMSDPSNKDIGVQVKSGDIFNYFVNTINTNKKLNLFTGLPHFEILDWLCSEVSVVVKDKRVHKLTIRERIILTLMKLKQNLSFSFLSVLFGNITPTTCRNIFKDIIRILAQILKAVLPWPSKSEILRRMPQCFKNFKNVRVVLDCTEIAIQKCKCLVCRIKLYSHYKSTLTLKYMTAVTPAGLICYVSQAYGGKASDKTIFEQSGIINQLETCDAVMVDKGFLIDSICAEKQIKVIRPSFLRGKTTFSKEEALLNKEIASARVHIERSNQRIKMFKYFSSKYEWCLFDVANETFTVVCALTNLCSPILSDDKF